MHFEFGQYLFDPRKGLSLGGRSIHLAPKALRMLHLLLAAGGSVVGKDALAVGVWGSAEVSDDSISRTVYRLRSAFQASGGPDVVETRYGSGFRVTTDVRPVRSQRLSTAQALAQSSNPSAVEAVLAARELAARRSPQDLDAAITSATTAIDLDPSYVAAWTTLAEIHVLQASRAVRPAREAGRLALQAADCALVLDPGCASALALRGWVVAAIEQRLAAGLADLDHAMAIDPDHAGTFVQRAWVLQGARRGDAAVVMMRQAQALNSVGPGVNANLAAHLLLAGRGDEALRAARDLAPRFATIDNAQAVASTVAAVHGLHDEAVAFGAGAVALALHTPAMHTALAYALARAGRGAEARRLLTAIESGPVSQAIFTAPVHLALGDATTAIARLTESCELGQPQFLWSADDPRLAALRGEPVVERLWAQLQRR